jgi:hypothetical protein
MPLLSKSEILYPHGQKKDSKSYKSKAMTIFSLACAIGPRLYSDFGLTNVEMPYMLMCVPLEQTQRLQAMVRREQAQRKRPL